MVPFDDRIGIRIIAATALAVLLVGWTGGFLEAEPAGAVESLVFGVLFVAFFAILVGLWFKLRSVDECNY